MQREISIRVTTQGTVIDSDGIGWWSDSGALTAQVELASQLPASWRDDVRAMLARLRSGVLNAKVASTLLGKPPERARCEVAVTTEGFAVKLSPAPAQELSAEVIVSSMPVAVLVTRNGIVSAGNHRLTELLGLGDPAQLRGKPLQQLLPNVEDMVGLLDACAGEPQMARLSGAGGRQVDVRLRAKTVGEHHIVTLDEAPGETGQHPPHESRLAGLGMLVAGVAHEINNPLTFVIPALEEALLLANAEGTDTRRAELQELLREALMGIERVAKIASDLREFKRSEEAVSCCDVNQVVVDTIQLAETRLRGRVSLSHSLGVPAEVLVNANRLGQVILNLILNAAQAMPERQSTEPSVLVRTWRRSGEVFVSVEDNGVGIPIDKLDKIFDPFFSTKNAGTGLGLSVCAGFVKRMGGWIEVNSTVGQGSAFTVHLPEAQKRTNDASSRGLHSPSLPPSSQIRTQRRDSEPPIRLLVVDDEPLVIRSVQRMLSRRASVVQAAGAWEAIRLLREGLEVDCIVSDMVMPEGGGEELWKWIVAHRPDLKTAFCFMTGMARGRSTDPDLPPTIHKPFSLDELQSAVARRARKRSTRSA